MDTQGVALVNMLRAVDLEARGAKKIERAPGLARADWGPPADAVTGNAQAVELGPGG